MGLRQRLSLAVAVLHEPQILILDEPTSGVDPVARDSFWELLIDLSRKQGVTIFVTTHFMNEGMRRDRISLMNAGNVLAADAPQRLIDGRKAASLEDAFIAYMEDAIAEKESATKEKKVQSPNRARETGAAARVAKAVADAAAARPHAGIRPQRDDPILPGPTISSTLRLERGNRSRMARQRRIKTETHLPDASSTGSLPALM